MKKAIFLLAASLLFAETTTVTVTAKKILYSEETQDLQTNGLAYLNMLRNKAGMTSLSLNPYLTTAANNHSNYCAINNYLGHEEYSGYEGFTGEWPSDRAIYAGYKSRQVSENLSSNNKDVNDSIDKLFSAIYHRLGFLDVTINEIGIGYAYGTQTGSVYTYDMGNSYGNAICSTTTPYNITGTYYLNMCADSDLKIPLDIWDNNISITKAQNPKIILWPYENATNILPVFYEEYPDPLPDYSVSGYPISVKFNDYYYKNAPDVTSFKLYDENMNEITDTRLLNYQTDPNSHLNEYEFALFPLHRLLWGKKYYVKVDYIDRDTNQSETLNWSFYTKPLGHPYYIVSQDEATINILPNKTYGIYLPPKTPTDLITGWSASYNTNDEVNMSFVDLNTILVNISGNIGDTVNVTFNDGTKLTLILSNEENDSLTYDDVIPTTEETTSTDVNDTQTLSTLDQVVSTLSSGWHILAFSEDVNFSDITVPYTIIWTYQNNAWCGYSNDETYKNILINNNQYCDGVEKNHGFWILK